MAIDLMLPTSGSISTFGYDNTKIECIKLSENSNLQNLVLLHGWGGNCSSLLSIGEPFKRYRNVWSISLPGFGKSPDPNTTFGTLEYVSLLKAWCDANEIEKTDIIAHSFGGRIALGFANLFPNSVDRLVLIGSAGLIEPKSLATKFKIITSKALRKLSNFGNDKLKETLNSHRQKFGSEDWRNANETMRNILVRVVNEDLTNQIRTVSTPTLMIWGENDSAVSLDTAKRMHKLLKNSELKVYANAGHFVFQERKSEVVACIWKFFELPTAW